jgi:hypothetical protein
LSAGLDFLLDIPRKRATLAIMKILNISDGQPLSDLEIQIQGFENWRRPLPKPKSLPHVSSRVLLELPAWFSLAAVVTLALVFWR